MVTKLEKAQAKIAVGEEPTSDENETLKKYELERAHTIMAER